MKTILENELNNVKTGQSFGQTFNSDGSVWNRDADQVDIVTLASVNLPQNELTLESFAAAIAPYAGLLANPAVKAGVFSFSQDGNPAVSIDINAVVPQEFRENSIAFALWNNQVAIWDAVKNESVPTGGNGDTRLTKPDEILAALDLLATGVPCL